ncbi:hypothetical protein N658DRAFT_270830 [Parathielavia hyrcaniae]|uniref:Uncharacterized protein n=1 Tax=Parathielavia hyrcaniae TaxID=113614 RepID=A0AAN6PTA4_9PEZI|nr:hypothetical protein N658DRAFT_270830 [Parathielavia hyrcaniae]
MPFCPTCSRCATSCPSRHLGSEHHDNPPPPIAVIPASHQHLTLSTAAANRQLPRGIGTSLATNRDTAAIRFRPLVRGIFRKSQPEPTPAMPHWHKITSAFV